MDTPDKDINWDKILDALDGTHTAPLSAEEEALLHTAREMQDSIAMREKFGVDEGWQRFVAARDARRPKVVGWKPVWKVAAAAALLGIIITSAWWIRSNNTKQVPVVAGLAQLPPSQQIILHTNGTSMALDSTLQTVQVANGPQVIANADSVVYQANNNNTTAAVRIDTVLVPRGHKIKVVLADGSGVWVNAVTRLIFPAAFPGATREVWVEGEAYFEVAKHPEQPFIVHARNQDIKVLATAFNVNTYETAAIQTTLTSGKVAVQAGSNTATLSPGQQAVYHANGNNLTTTNVDTRIFTAWKDNDLYFEDASLTAIVNTLGRSFDYEFKFEDATLAGMHFTLDMQQPATLQEVLDKIQLTAGNVKFRVDQRTIYVGR